MASIRDHVDIIIRLIFGFAIAIGCYYIVSPFLTAIIIAAIITIVSWPMFARCKNSFAEYSTPAAFVMVGLLVVCLIIPLSFLSAVIAQQLPGVISGGADLIRSMQAPEWLKDIPMVGPWLYNQIAIVFEPEALNELIRKLIDPISREVLTVALSLGNGLIQMGLVAFIAFFFYRDGDTLAKRSKELLDRVSGGLSDELSSILVNTTRSVVWGIVGTAACQSIVACIGFLIVGVPGTLLLTVAVFILSVVPIGPPLVWIPVAIWLYTQGSVGMAIFMVAWGTLAVASVDNFVKPLIIARGTPLPISLVFLGVFGGVIAFGFLGLILGPVLLAIGMAMVKTWLSQSNRKKIAKAAATIHFPAPNISLDEKEKPLPPSHEVDKNKPSSGSKQAVPRRDHPRSFPSGKKRS